MTFPLAYDPPSTLTMDMLTQAMDLLRENLNVPAHDGVTYHLHIALKQLEQLQLPSSFKVHVTTRKNHRRYVLRATNYLDQTWVVTGNKQRSIQPRAPRIGNSKGTRTNTPP